LDGAEALGQAARVDGRGHGGPPGEVPRSRSRWVRITRRDRPAR
jgi:hypothetical protein